MHHAAGAWHIWNSTGWCEPLIIEQPNVWTTSKLWAPVEWCSALTTSNKIPIYAFFFWSNTASHTDPLWDTVVISKLYIRGLKRWWYFLISDHHLVTGSLNKFIIVRATLHHITGIPFQGHYWEDVSGDTLHYWLLGLGFGWFHTLTPAHALCLPTIDVQVFCTKPRIEVWGPVSSAVCQSSVIGVKSEVQGANEEANIESSAS